MKQQKLPNSGDKTRFSNRRRPVNHAEYSRAGLSLAWAHLELVSKSLQQNSRTSPVSALLACLQFRVYEQHTRGDQVWFPEILGRKVLEKLEYGNSFYLTTDS